MVSTTILFSICIIGVIFFLFTGGSNFWFTVVIVSFILCFYQSQESEPKMEETEEYKTGYQHGYYDKGREIRFKDSINEIKQ